MDEQTTPVSAEPTMAKAITDAFEKNPDEVTPVKDGPHTVPLEDLMKDPNMAKQIRRWQREMKARAPKHENYKECRKRCPLFKECECFRKSAAEQMECWTVHTDQLYLMIDGGCEETKKGYNPHCHACGNYKKCIALVKDKIGPKPQKPEENKEDANAATAAVEPGPTSPQE